MTAPAPTCCAHCQEERPVRVVCCRVTTWRYPGGRICHRQLCASCADHARGHDGDLPILGPTRAPAWAGARGARAPSMDEQEERMGTSSRRLPRERHMEWEGAPLGHKRARGGAPAKGSGGDSGEGPGR
jgi:hypothetical protein